MRVIIAVELESSLVEGLRAAFPEVEFVEARGKERMLAEAPTADILYGGHPTPEFVAAALRLRWVQAFSAGVNHLPLEKLAERNIPLTNASGAHGIPIAENILAMMLAFAIRLPALVEARERREWVAGKIAPEKQELDGQTLLVVGLGAIGGTLARKASALGLHVIGLRNRPLPPPEGVAETIPHERLHEALGRADHVALCLPLTEETTAFLGEAELRAMKRTAYVYNVGRGQSIEREALLRALREGWIAGAGLDVTDPEPLPPDDLLWSLPNVILSQHTSGHSPHIDERVTNLFADNLRRFLAGEPLINQVDYVRRY